MKNLSGNRGEEILRSTVDNSRHKKRNSDFLAHNGVHKNAQMRSFEGQDSPEVATSKSKKSQKQNSYLALSSRLRNSRLRNDQEEAAEHRNLIGEREENAAKAYLDFQHLPFIGSKLYANYIVNQSQKSKGQKEVLLERTLGERGIE